MTPDPFEAIGENCTETVITNKELLLVGYVHSIVLGC